MPFVMDNGKNIITNGQSRENKWNKLHIQSGKYV